MKKLLLLGVLLLPAVPCFIAGIETDNRIKAENRDAMLRERFISWCAAEGYRLDTMSENESEIIWLDMWTETDDYQEAADSIDRVLREREINYLFND